MDLSLQAKKLEDQKNKLKEQAKKIETREKFLKEKLRIQLLEKLAEKTLGKKWNEKLEILLKNNESIELYVNGEKYFINE